MKMLTLFLVTCLSGSINLHVERNKNPEPELQTVDRNAPGPIIKAEVTANYINLFRIKSDSLQTTQRAVFPKGSVLSITAHNPQSGNPDIYVTFNEAREELYREPIKLTAKGRHTLKIRAIDPEKNESSLVITYLIIE